MLQAAIAASLGQQDAPIDLDGPEERPSKRRRFEDAVKTTARADTEARYWKPTVVKLRIENGFNETSGLSLADCIGPPESLCSAILIS